MVEHLADFEERCKFLRRAYFTYTDAIRENNRYLEQPWKLDDSNSVEDSLLHLISGADTCRRWALNYNERTGRYEMTLFHLAEQADGKVNEGNAQTNIGLSVMAMVFLPGTFVAVRIRVSSTSSSQETSTPRILSTQNKYCSILPPSSSELCLL